MSGFHPPSQSNNPFTGGHEQTSHQGDSTNNPWADEASSRQYETYAPPPGPPPQAQQSYQQPSQQPPQSWETTENPWGGADSAQQPLAPGLPPRRTGTFDEEAFVPEAERGEQREAMEQFEMSRNEPEDSTDSNVAKLQEEFPSLDGSLIAAIYGDSKNMGATREMLQELAASSTT